MRCLFCLRLAVEGEPLGVPVCTSHLAQLARTEQERRARELSALRKLLWTDEEEAAKPPP